MLKKEKSMLSDNIKKLRTEKNLTQKDLANKLHVTSQAVSRWEKGEVEPSVSTIGEMAKIFEVTVDEIISGQNKQQHKNVPPPPPPKIETKVEKEIVVKETKPVLAVCEKCNKPIYNGDEIVREYVGGGYGRHGHRSSARQRVICKDCDNQERQASIKSEIECRKSQRKKSYIYSGIYSSVVLLLMIFVLVFDETSKNDFIPYAIALPILTFTFSSCIYLSNNFVGHMFLAIASWGVVKFPGLIFEFSLDGFAWLIGMKILFWILGFLIGLCAIILALVLCLPTSAVVYPFALIKNIKGQQQLKNT